jgi:hypothetical protein
MSFKGVENTEIRNIILKNVMVFVIRLHFIEMQFIYE